MPEHSTGWAGPHRALGLTPACGHGAMAEHINSQIMVIWLEKRIAQTSDTVVRDHLERSLGWLKKALAAEHGSDGCTEGAGTPSGDRLSRGSRL